uniref:Uncharacterized protein n=1 Tax=Timema douglasi TaxID=61478 RepID=A0A7R8Z7Z8_TIMDO|nr:unnamed protein product [Timema douglasi]
MALGQHPVALITIALVALTTIALGQHPVALITIALGQHPVALITIALVALTTMALGQHPDALTTMALGQHPVALTTIALGQHPVALTTMALVALTTMAPSQHPVALTTIALGQHPVALITMALGKTTLIRLNQDSNPDLLVIFKPIRFKSNALYHSATEIAVSEEVMTRDIKVPLFRSSGDDVTIHALEDTETSVYTSYMPFWTGLPIKKGKQGSLP